MPALFRKLCRIRVKPPDAFTAGHETEEDGTAIGNFIRLPQDIAVQIRTRDNQSVQFPVLLHLQLDKDEARQPCMITATWNGLTHESDDVEVSSNLCQSALATTLLEYRPHKRLHDVQSEALSLLNAISSLATLEVYAENSVCVADELHVIAATPSDFSTIQQYKEHMCDLFLRRISHVRIGEVLCLGVSAARTSVCLLIKCIVGIDGKTYDIQSNSASIHKLIPTGMVNVDVQSSQSDEGSEKRNSKEIIIPRKMFFRTICPPWVVSTGKHHSNKMRKESVVERDMLANVVDQDTALHSFMKSFPHVSKDNKSVLNSISSFEDCEDCVFMNLNDFENIRSSVGYNYDCLYATVDVASMRICVNCLQCCATNEAPCILYPSSKIPQGVLQPSSACLFRLVLMYGINCLIPGIEASIYCAHDQCSCIGIHHSNGFGNTVVEGSLLLRPVKYFFRKGKTHVGPCAFIRKQTSHGMSPVCRINAKVLDEVGRKLSSLFKSSLERKPVWCWYGCLVRIDTGSSVIDFVVANRSNQPLIFSSDTAIYFGEMLNVDLSEKGLGGSAVVYWNDWPLREHLILSRTMHHVWDGPIECCSHGSICQQNYNYDNDDVACKLPCGIVDSQPLVLSLLKYAEQCCFQCGHGASIAIKLGRGMGKTTLLGCLLRNALLSFNEISFVEAIDGKDLASMSWKQSFSKLYRIYDRVCSGAQGVSFLFIDNASMFFGDEESPTTDKTKKSSLKKGLLQQFCFLTMKRKFFIFVTSDLGSHCRINSRWFKLLVSSRHAFGTHLESQKRPSVLCTLSSRIIMKGIVSHSTTSVAIDINWREVRSRVHLGTFADVYKFLNQVLTPALLYKRYLGTDTLNSLMCSAMPLPKMSPSVEEQWLQHGVMGMEHAKQRLLESVILPVRWPRLYAKAGGTPSGVLLYGPSGCGKTKIAEKVACIAGVSIRKLKGPELLSKYIGESEQNVREVFKRAFAEAPSIILFDEFDSIATPRGSQLTTGVNDRIVNQLLTMLDGFDTVGDNAESSQNTAGKLRLSGWLKDFNFVPNDSPPSASQVFVIATTSRRDLIDSALLRSGRIDKHILCSEPTDSEKLQLLYNSVSASTMDKTALRKLGEFVCNSSNCNSYADVGGLLTTVTTLASHRSRTEAEFTITDIDVDKAIGQCSTAAGKSICPKSNNTHQKVALC